MGVFNWASFNPEDLCQAPSLTQNIRWNGVTATGWPSRPVINANSTAVDDWCVQPLQYTISPDDLSQALSRAIDESVERALDDAVDRSERQAQADRKLDEFLNSFDDEKVQV